MDFKLKEHTEDEQGLLDAYDTPVDFREKENIRPLIEFVRRSNEPEQGLFHMLVFLLIRPKTKRKS